MLNNFTTYQLALQLYKQRRSIALDGIVKDQFDRATLSIVLNLAEGSGKLTAKDRRRFYSIAFGSLRETQALLALIENHDMIGIADKLGAHIYKLIQKPI